MLTVVIPSFERQEYLIHAIHSCLIHKDLKVLVNDNSLSPLNLKEYFDEKNLERITYNWTDQKLSVVQNFSRNLENISTKYICFIGDDDAIGPEILQGIKKMDQYNMDALTLKPGKALHYFWGGSKHPIWGDIGETLFYDDYTWNYEKINLKKALKQANSKLGEGPQGLPRLYLGIIKTTMFYKILAKYNNIFGGYSPDIYSSILLSYNIKNAYYVDAPLIIPGACKKSTSGLRAERRDIGSLEGDNHLNRFEKIEWHKLVPKIYTPYTVWGCTHLLALDRVKNDLYKPKINNYLISKLLVEVSYKSEKIKKFYSQKSIYNKICIILCISQILTSKGLRLIKLVIHRNPGGAKYRRQGLESIFKALTILQK